jgi:MFS transporter, MCT family, solute carrier family 16 (monocarboxylic acid transporters), member 10
MNVMIPFTAAAGVLTYAWPFARTKASLIAVTVLYGCVNFLPRSSLFCTHMLIVIARISSGSYVSLLSNPMMEFGDTKDVGRRLGMFMSIFSLGALAGPPISGAINTATGGFEAVGYYAGAKRA